MVMADVIVIFAPGQCDRLDDEALALAFAATNIERLHSGAVACTVPGDMVHQIEHHPGVGYVRRVQTFEGSAAA
jgi:hypothetical protein